MKNCPFCNAEVNENAAFCAECGGKLDAAVVTEKTTESRTESEPAAEAEQQPVCEKPVKDSSADKKGKKKKKGWLVALFVALGGALAAIVAVILVVAIIVGSIFIIGSGKKGESVLFFKDGEVFYSEFKMDAPRQITDRFIETDLYEDIDEVCYGMRNDLGYYTILSEDGKTLFYVDHLSDEEGFSVYFVSLKDEGSEPEKIDSGITNYTINKKGDIITYVKDGDLYQHNLTDREKISTEIDCCYVSEDGKSIVYLTDDEDLYYKEENSEKEKIDTKVLGLSAVSEDLSTILYTKETGLFKCTNIEEKEKIQSGENIYVQAYYETGEFYFTITEAKELPLSKYVEDDLIESDGSLTEPEYPDIFDYWYDDNWDAYDDAVDRYYEQKELYDSKEERDWLRDELKEATTEIEVRTMYYYDGSSVQKVAENIDQVNLTAAEKAVAVYTVVDYDTMPTIKMSEIDGLSDVKDWIWYDGSEKSEKVFVATKKDTAKIDKENVGSFEVDSKAENLYFKQFTETEEDEKDKGDTLYKYSLSSGTSEVYDTLVFDYRLFENDSLALIKDAKDSDDDIGTLYIDKELIDYDVYLYGVTQVEESNNYVYYSNYNDEKRTGTLKTYKKEKVKIADDVSDYTITEKGNIVYIKDYDMTDYRGEMFLYSGKESTKVDEDVTAIIKQYEILGAKYLYQQ